MKKTLLTTTALVMGAGMASADVSLTGTAEMGVADSKADSKDDSLRFHTDIDVTFGMSGTTDGGIAFGANVDLDENIGNDGVSGNTADGATNNDDAHGGAVVFLNGGFGNVNLGDTDGAYDWALTETSIGGSIRDNQTGHSGYDGNSGLDGTHDGQILRYDITVGDFGFKRAADFVSRLNRVCHRTRWPLRIAAEGEQLI